MSNAPQDDSHYCDDTDEPLDARELVLHGSDRYDSSTSTRLESYKKQEPYEKNGYNADGKSDKEPDAPTGLRAHVLQRNDVLWGGDG